MNMSGGKKPLLNGVTAKIHIKNGTRVVKRILANPKNLKASPANSAGHGGEVTEDELVGLDVNPQPTKECHFAVFPEKLIEPCILAGSRIGDTVCDIFGGSGTTGRVAKRLNRKAVLIELNPEYCEMSLKDLAQNTFSFQAIK